MTFHGSIHQFPKEVKLLIIVFISTLSIGFYTGISFVRTTTGNNSTGIEQRYLGNENDEKAVVMKFKKSKGEIMTTIHSHILSLSVIFFIISLLLTTTSIHQKLKLFLIIEPFISLFLTFGGIYLLWSGITWLKYIVMISGFLMTVTFAVSTLLILQQLFSKKQVH